MPDAHMIIGVDRPKDEAVLVEAYDDPAGVTAGFQSQSPGNVSTGHSVPTSILSHFKHKALWNAGQSRIEMHLESLADQSVTIGETDIRFTRGRDHPHGKLATSMTKRPLVKLPVKAAGGCLMRTPTRTGCSAW